MHKKELLKECADQIRKPEVAKWYKENLETKSQYDTINALEAAILNKRLSAREALSIALIVGVQWDIKFKGTP